MTLSSDLRERVMVAVLSGESCRSASRRFGVSAASVVRWASAIKLQAQWLPRSASFD